MPYCPKCGSQIDDNARFCPSCGSSVSLGDSKEVISSAGTGSPAYAGGTNQDIPQSYIVRDREKALLQRIFDYFNAKKAEYDEYDHVQEQLYRYKNGAKKAMLIVGIILLGISGFFMLVSLVMGAAAGGRNVAVAMLGGAVYAIFPFIPGLILLLSYIGKNKKYKKIYAKLDERFGQLTDELVNNYNSFSGPFGFSCPIGFEYSNPGVIQAIAGVLQSGRAYTIQEAINLLLDDAHKANMEAISMQTAMSARAAARNAGVAAAFSAASFFFG